MGRMSVHCTCACTCTSSFILWDYEVL